MKLGAAGSAQTAVPWWLSVFWQAALLVVPIHCCTLLVCKSSHLARCMHEVLRIWSALHGCVVVVSRLAGCMQQVIVQIVCQSFCTTTYCVQCANHRSYAKEVTVALDCIAML
jgi:hypothetical protein